MRISLIAAVAENGVIGAQGAMPWHVSPDLKRFKRITMGKPLIMGGKTFRSIGRALPGRDNIVITRAGNVPVEDVIPAESLEAAIETARERAMQRAADEIMVIGGGDIYRQALPLASRIYLTEVHASPDGDVRFPELDMAQWRETEREKPQKGDRDSAACSFVILDRLK